MMYRNIHHIVSSCFHISNNMETQDENKKTVKKSYKSRSVWTGRPAHRKRKSMQADKVKTSENTDIAHKVKTKPKIAVANDSESQENDDQNEAEPVVAKKPTAKAQIPPKIANSNTKQSKLVTAVQKALPMHICARYTELDYNHASFGMYALGTEHNNVSP